MNLSPISKYFQPKRILDVGANVGQFYKLCRNAFPESYIFSIEASIDCEPHLKAVTSDYYIGLLGKTNEVVKFYKNRSDPVSTGNSIYKELTPHFSDDNLTVVEQRCIRLDDLFPNGTFDLIKIDTQGSELDIISGGLKICSRAKGVLLEVSITRYNEGAPLYDEVIKFMSDLGFEKAEILDETNIPIVHQQDVLFIKHDL